MRQRPGFTVIELLVIIVILSTASVLFFIQKNNIERTSRDDQRKTAINAMYYGLEEVYYKKHQSYPRTLTPDSLPSVDSKLFTDPDDIKLGQTSVTDDDDEEVPVKSSYNYEGLNCSDSSCKSYTLSTTLENEDDFVRKSRN